MSRRTFTLPFADGWIAKGQEQIAASRVGNAIFTSSIPGIDPKTGKLAEGPEAQFAMAFDNLQRLLETAGAGPESIGLLTVWIPDRTNRAHIGKPWLKLFPGANRPARKTNQAPLPAGMEVQLMASAYLGAERKPVEIPGLSHKEPLPMGAIIGPMVFSSVIAPEDPKTGKLVEEPLPQIEQCFENMRLFMKAAGSSDANINHVWVFMKDFSWQPPMVNEWVNSYPVFGDRPSRKTVPYDLAGETQIQVQLTGYLEGTRKDYEVHGVGHDDPIPMASSVGKLLQSSGIFGIDPATGLRVKEFHDQIDKGLLILRHILDQAGARLDQVTQIIVMLQDYSVAPALEAAITKLFGESGPALKFVHYNMPAAQLVQFHVTAMLD